MQRSGILLSAVPRPGSVPTPVSTGDRAAVPQLAMIRDAVPADAAQVVDIYNHYVLNSVITFEEAAVTAEEMATRIADVRATLPWLVYETDGRIDGYCYATKWRVRAAYRFAVETTVYLRPGLARRGLGTQLYEELIERLRTLGRHIAIGGIALPNDASVGLHERMGFVKVAHFPQVGWKFDRWIDVGYWQLKL
jgi:L-amino acid N-acyltransferase YncA